jgi:AcrR family transcriptional regulator
MRSKAAKTNVRSKKSPRDRVLQEALDLFYRQGYESTGMNQLLEQAGVFRKSFYTYFEGKEALGLEYLAAQDRAYIGQLRLLMCRHSDVRDMIGAWCGLLARRARAKKFAGCPFSNFAGQTLDQAERFGPALREVMRGWQNELAAYFAGATFQGKCWNPARDSGELALRFLASYEGWTQMYLMMRDANLLPRLEGELLAMAGECYG